MSDVQLSPGVADAHTPQTPDGLKTQATVGALLAIFGCADSLVRLGMMDKRINQKMGLPALQRCYNEIDKVNKRFTAMWNIKETDHMNYLFSDAAVIMMVLATVDVESRTNLSNEFRRVWGQLLAGVGEEGAEAAQQHIIDTIRFDRGLSPVDPTTPGTATDVFDHITFDVDGVKKEVVVPRVPLTAAEILEKGQQALNAYMTGQEVDLLLSNVDAPEQALALEDVKPNCLVFLRDKYTRQLIAGDVSVSWKGGVADSFAFDPDGLFERQYPVNEKLLFTGRADGYLYGGCDQFFYEGDEAQLVVNIFLTPKPIV